MSMWKSRIISRIPTRTNGICGNLAPVLDLLPETLVKNHGFPSQTSPGFPGACPSKTFQQKLLGIGHWGRWIDCQPFLGSLYWLKGKSTGNYVFSPWNMGLSGQFYLQPIQWLELQWMCWFPGGCNLTTLLHKVFEVDFPSDSQGLLGDSKCMKFLIVIQNDCAYVGFDAPSVRGQMLI